MGGRAANTKKLKSPPVHIGIRSHGERHNHRQPGEPIREVEQKAKRRFVGPLCVVDRKDQRATFGEVRDEPVQAVQSRECDVACLPRRRECR